MTTALLFSVQDATDETAHGDSSRCRVLYKPSIAADRLEVWRPGGAASPIGWCSVRFDDTGWSTGDIKTYDDLRTQFGPVGSDNPEIAIPVLETVFRPDISDKIYYDAIIQSDIALDDKVLVIGPGSGADAWAVSLKSRASVHVIDINPMAVTNTLITARLGGFDVKPFVGDIRSAKLPKDFRDFNYVLWNMPFVKAGANATDFESRNFHDGDDGTLLRDFLARLPALLADEGVAILLNDPLADTLFHWPNTVRQAAPTVNGQPPGAMLFHVRFPRGGALDRSYLFETTATATFAACKIVSRECSHSAIRDKLVAPGR